MIRLQRTAEGRRGGALITVLIVTSLVAGMAAMVLTLTTSSVKSVEHERMQIQALFAAEAGLSAAMNRLAVSHNTGAAVAPNIGTLDAPVQQEVGEYCANLRDNGDGSFTVFTVGISGLTTRSIEAVVTPVPAGPMDHSMYAGNLSGDSSYELTLGGTGGQADDVSGDIYSGGDIVIEGDASVSGEIRSGGTVTGAAGRENMQAELPHILEVDYSTFHDFDVADLFSAATSTSDDAGGTAMQLPESSPAHIFRKNPSDRTSDTSSTVKEDYFLEDPYETVRSDSYREDGSDAYDVTLPADGNNRVYYIDGNLWLHNKRTRSFKIKNDSPFATQVTFVVSGNVYFSDNLFYDDPDMDGVAFIALSDPDVEDSGNIYFGDPVFGTMKFAESMMFAENNFVDNNLDASGSSTVTIRGNMTAGNQVAIERDYEHGNGTVSHTRLSLEFDDRQSNGELSLPGIPTVEDHPVGYTVATWREVAAPRLRAFNSGANELPDGLGEDMIQAQTGNGPGGGGGGGVSAQVQAAREEFEALRQLADEAMARANEALRAYEEFMEMYNSLSKREKREHKSERNRLKKERDSSRGDAEEAIGDASQAAQTLADLESSAQGHDWRERWRDANKNWKKNKRQGRWNS